MAMRPANPSHQYTVHNPEHIYACKGHDGRTKDVYKAVLIGEDGKFSAEVVSRDGGDPISGRYRRYGKRYYPVGEPAKKAKEWGAKEGKQMEDTARQRSIERQVAAKIAAQTLGPCELNTPDVDNWLSYFKQLTDGVVEVIRNEAN